MTKVALGLAAFALISGLYGSIRVIPKYQEAEKVAFGRPRAAFNSPEYQAQEAAGQERERWRSRSQKYAFGIVGAALVSLILGFLALRRKEPRGQAIAAMVMAGLSLGFVAYFQGMANIF